jgi:prepilin-type N-terminal cleavage/methylation domain-containing protein/prepilin-type processing-associated H-X9-DG protein
MNREYSLMRDYLDGMVSVASVGELNLCLRSSREARRGLLRMAREEAEFRQSCRLNREEGKVIYASRESGMNSGVNSWRRQSNAAFTLVELLVAVAILSILGALLLPTLGKAISMATQVACINNMKQQYCAYSMYDGDFGRQPPRQYEAEGNPPAAVAPGFGLCHISRWQGFGSLYGSGYLNDGKVFYCPSRSNQVTKSTAFGQPGDLSYSGRNGTKVYGWSPTGTQSHNNYWTRWCEWTVNRTETLNPAQLAVMRARLSANSPDRWLLVDMWGFYKQVVADYWMPHPGGVNVLFVGGHAKHLKTSLDDIWASPGNAPDWVIPRLTGKIGVTTP